MTVQNLAPFVANLINKQSIPGLSAVITDSSGGTHSAIAVSLPSQNSVTYVVIDPNVFNPLTAYTATQVTLSLGNTVIVQLNVNVQISYKSNSLAVQVTVNDGTGYDFAPVIRSLVVPALMGVTPTNYSVTLQWIYIVGQYAVSNNTCSLAVRQYTERVYNGGSASGSGMTLRLSVTITYGSCQTVQPERLNIIVNNDSTGGIPFPSQPESQLCGYNQTCNATFYMEVTL